MKARTLVLFLLAATIPKSLGAAIDLEPIEYITIEDPSLETGETNDYVDGIIRIKRSGSPDFFGIIKNGIKSKISQLASASAGASAHFSKSSSSHDGGHDEHHYSPHPEIPSSYDHKSFDFWALKKSILNTLLQAVKAIKGGVIAIKGQLIKGGGALVSAKGKLIAMKGEAITKFGKSVATSAKLIPHPSSFHSSVHHEEYHSAPTGHSGPSAPAHPHPPPVEYAPSSHASGPSPDYGAPASGYGQPSGHGHSEPSQPYLPQKFSNAYDALRSKIPPGAEAGIVILKKIPSHKGLSAPAHSGIATLPLQDDHTKHVSAYADHSDAHSASYDVSKPELPPLFKPLSSHSPPSHPPEEQPHKLTEFFASASKYSSPSNAPTAHDSHEEQPSKLSQLLSKFKSTPSMAPTAHDSHDSHDSHDTHDLYGHWHPPPSEEPPSKLTQLLSKFKSSPPSMPPTSHDSHDHWHSSEEQPHKLSELFMTSVKSASSLSSPSSTPAKPVHESHDEPPSSHRGFSGFSASGGHNSGPSGFSSPGSHAIPSGNNGFGYASNYGTPHRPAYMDDPIIQGPTPLSLPSSNYNLVKPISGYYSQSKPAYFNVGQNKLQQNKAVELPKLPPPFEINSFGDHSHLSSYGGTLGNIHSSPASFVKHDFGTYAPSFGPSSHSGLDSYPTSSNLQYKNLASSGFSHHKGIKDFDVVKSVSYELSRHKRRH